VVVDRFLPELWSNLKISRSPNPFGLRTCDSCHHLLVYNRCVLILV